MQTLVTKYIPRGHQGYPKEHKYSPERSSRHDELKKASGIILIKRVLVLQLFLKDGLKFQSRFGESLSDTAL